MGLLKIPAQSGSRQSGAGRWVLAGVLVAVLFLGGVYDEQVFTFLTATWQKLFAALGLSRQADALQQGIHRGVTRRALPAVATYALLYIGVCLLLLRLLVPDARQWRTVLYLYIGIVGAYAVLVLAGKLAGDAAWAYKLSRHLIDFLVSPLPVAGLLVLFRAGLVPRSPGPTLS